MTTATLPATVGTLDHPTQHIETGRAYDVLPDGGHPLRYWRVGYTRLEQHSNYTGTHRPTRVTVDRVERNNQRDSNVAVNFTDDRGIHVQTWVHHSFLVPEGTAPAVIQIDVTMDQKVDAVSQYMVESIGTEDWPDAGEPSDWGDDTRDRWFAAGNRAVLEQRATIEAGNANAGRVWCRAANVVQGFGYDTSTEEFLHQWFVDNRGTIDNLLAALTPAATPTGRPWDTGRVERTKQTVYTPDGQVGLVLAEDNVVNTNDRAGTIKVYKRNTGNWRDSYVPQSEVNFAVPGDAITNHGQTGLFVRNHNDEMLTVTVNGVQAEWRRQDCVYTGIPAVPVPPEPPITDLFVTVGGIEYVRKDVVDKDLESMTGTMHRGATNHSLCGVYDEVQREADARTEYLKFGARFATYSVQVLEMVPVLRTIRVERVVDETTAQAQALQVARDYPLPAPTSSRGTEQTRLQRGNHTVTHQGTSRLDS